MISGLCFGFAFGVGGLGAAILGKLADVTSINHVFQVCSYLPAVGLLTAFLPNLEPVRLYATEEVSLKSASNQMLGHCPHAAPPHCPAISEALRPHPAHCAISFIGRGCGLGDVFLEGTHLGSHAEVFLKFVIGL